MGTAPTDDEPFADASEEGRAEATRVLIGPVLGQSAEAAVLRNLRARVVAWGVERGALHNESNVEFRAEGVLVRVPLYEVSQGSAAVYGRTVRRPTGLSMALYRRSWTHRLWQSLGATRVLTEDADFDAAVHISSKDPVAARQLVDKRCRSAFLPKTIDYVRYRGGEIEVRVIHPRLCGAHVVQGIEAVVALALAETPLAPYR